MYQLTIKLQYELTLELWDLISGLLYQNECVGIDEGEFQAHQDTPLIEANEFEQALSPEALMPPKTFTVYFSSQEHAQQALTTLLPHLQPQQAEHTISEVEEKDYVQEWKKNFRPFAVEPFWWIRTPWHQEQGLAHQKEILIEPGMAFGTGTHETTRSCLELLAIAYKERPFVRFLDFGCGSGILSVAMKHLGAQEVQAVDIDPLALEATQMHAKLNNISLETSAQVPKDLTFDCIVANILKNTLLTYAQALKEWLQPSGFLILSGLLLQQSDEVQNHFEGLGFSLKQKLIQGEWVTLWFTKV